MNFPGTTPKQQLLHILNHQYDFCWNSVNRKKKHPYLSPHNPPSRPVLTWNPSLQMQAPGKRPRLICESSGTQAPVVPGPEQAHGLHGRSAPGATPCQAQKTQIRRLGKGERINECWGDGRERKDCDRDRLFGPFREYRRDSTISYTTTYAILLFFFRSCILRGLRFQGHQTNITLRRLFHPIFQALLIFTLAILLVYCL